MVLGATGTTGRRVRAALERRGVPLRAASRHGPVRFDWGDRTTWDAALGGATRLWLMAPDGVPVDPALVELAARRGVRRVVLLSSSAVEEMGDARLLAAEAAVRGAGVPWTVLRADWFDQDFSEGFLAPGVAAGEVALPLGDLRQAWVDVADVAEVGAALLAGDARDGAHEGEVLEVRGPQALTLAECVHEVAVAAGRPVRAVTDPGAYVAGLEAVGVPREEAQGALAAFAALVARGDDPDGDDLVARVTGRPARSFRDWARAAAAEGAWQAPGPPA
ncbi:NmrA family transcriptional regulator [Vallicoccus soli]|uniref:NmrA family transcriptional regulator n=1 Tax=Vallicoccus soli TaxID=2339232 RepID=A0A3A3ZGL4_9ACTN|nr:NmrA family transcriptional regulator [Vallicoccus soli]